VKISDYRKHVNECHALLRGARSPEERQMLLNMAETREGLAVAREKNWRKRGKLRMINAPKWTTPIMLRKAPAVHARCH
jgi:hypothetical protein